MTAWIRGNLRRCQVANNNLPTQPPKRFPTGFPGSKQAQTRQRTQESNQEQFEVTPEPPPNKEENGSLPDWLAGIRPTTTEPSEGTPALILNKDESTTPVDENEPVFSMETPEWLSKINPEQAAEKTPQGAAEGSALENPEVSELPSWVQAMRPVELVVAEVKPDLEEGAGITEQSGPLAGLSGVLPVGPGLGQLE